MSGHRFHSSRRKRQLRHETLESRELLTVNLSPEDQLLLELVNRARADPLAEIERNLSIAQADPEIPREDWVTDLNQDVGEDDTISADPKQPLAPHQSLADAMEAHVKDMIARDYFGHDSPEGSTPSSRARAAGYTTGAGENIAWSGNSGGIDELEEVYSRHQGLVASVGHRINMMRENWREIGPAVTYGEFRQDFKNFDSIMVGTLFGNRRGDNFITGVAISDLVVRNNFYEVGEGIGRVTITATRAGDDETFTDVTGQSGGYSIQVPDGTYTVTATGPQLPIPLTVRGVVVDGENVKVDFNNLSMPTRLIAGQFFEDLNNNRRRDPNEPPLVQRKVYVDLNDDAKLDENEPLVESDSSGNYVLDGLLPGEYTIRQVLPNGWGETAPVTTYVIPLTTQNIVGVDFGSVTTNESPVAANDEANVISGQSVTIDVLQNDVDPDGALDAGTLRIERTPRRGTVSVVGMNSFIYRSSAGFTGSDTFTYSVADDSGARSNTATVQVTVARALPFQNPANPLDVDGDGFVVSRDALLIINELNRNGAHSLEGEVPSGQLPHLYDVSGDEFVSSIDALRIIQHINRRSASGEAAGGEPSEAQPATARADRFFALLATDQEDDEQNQRLFYS